MRSEKGYTLIEILVAVTILGIAGGMLFATFNSGLQSYKKGETRNLLMEQARGGLRMLSADLEAGVPLEDQQKFDSRSISFVTLQRDPDSRLVQVDYRFDAGRLLRTARPLLATEDVGAGQAAAVIEDLEQIDFQLRRNGQWQNEQQEPEQAQAQALPNSAPDALKVQLKLSRKGEEVEFETVLFLPVLHAQEQESDEQIAQ